MTTNVDPARRLDVRDGARRVAALGAATAAVALYGGLSLAGLSAPGAHLAPRIATAGPSSTGTRVASGDPCATSLVVGAVGSFKHPQCAGD